MDFIVTGTVVPGNKIGRNLGFPTANIPVSNFLELENGVYAGYVSLDGKKYSALVSVGVRPTLGKVTQRLLEAHLLGYSGDLYGRTLDITLKAFIRPEKRFDSLEALRLQIEQDKLEIIKQLASC